MKKFEISHPDFEGSAELTYNNGYLVAFSVLETNMPPKMCYDFIRAIPIKEVNLKAYAVQTGSVVVSKNWTYSLEDFKHDYPYARNMHLLPKIWAKLSATDLVKISIATPKYRKWTEREKEKNANYTPKIAYGWLLEKQYLNDWDKL